MSNDLSGIKAECARRGITRLCHFAPSRNLLHILAGRTGILATCHLENDERQVFNPTDLKRLDGHKSHVCCSIEYPNAWYFRRARAAEILFEDWVVLLLRPDYLWRAGTLFCPRNAAAGFGSQITGGLPGFLQLFRENVQGAGGNQYGRAISHLACCPTDDQAEVMVPDCVALADIVAVAVRDDKQAAKELCRLRLAQIASHPAFVVAPIFFEPRQLSQCIRRGTRPLELPPSTKGVA